jgi:3',5'-cyclic AMP phosphodiesterase CpdA
MDQMPKPRSIGVIADPHYFEPFADYGAEQHIIGGRPGASVRTLRQTVKSTRLFNENALTLPAMLESCAKEGLKTVIIAGDLSDDGQIACMSGAVAILERFSRQYGMRFFLTPGNHDVFGMFGRHHTKAFVDSAGRNVETNSADEPAALQFCNGYPKFLEPLRAYGFFRQPSDLLWESPFGSSDLVEDRTYDIWSPDGLTSHRQIDASYLVEPEEGLWLLSLDANVFVPRDGMADQSHPDAVEDSTNAGWNAVVRHRPYLLEWMRDVGKRASMLGKQLVTFTHYPTIDPLKGTRHLELELFGPTQFYKRTPTPETSAAVAATGIRNILSGHMHVDDVSTISAGGQSLTNHALPSAGAFPPLWKVLTLDGPDFALTDRAVEVERYSTFFEIYRRELTHAALDTWGLFESRNYADLIDAQVRMMVFNRYMIDEWPQDLAIDLKFMTLGDVLRRVQATPLDNSFGELPMTELLVDFYRLRNGQRIALQRIPSERTSAYEQFARSLATAVGEDRFTARMRIFAQMLGSYLGVWSTRVQATSSSQQDAQSPAA